ncbi:hypothetical protein V2J09_008627 [Rumex salicifolius]
MAARVSTCIAILLVTFYVAYATDPSQLQDFCVATNNPMFVNGEFCKNPMDVTADDFLFRGLNVAGNTNNQLGSIVTPVNVRTFPALNTQGISLARVDLAPYGVNPPHFHPRATEVTTLLQGVAYVGFVASDIPNLGNKFFTKVLYPGDVFVFPKATIHFEMNIGKTPAVLLVAFTSQNPGVTTIANATFGSNPLISVDVLSKSFQLDDAVVNNLQSTFGKY